MSHFEEFTNPHINQAVDALYAQTFALSRLRDQAEEAAMSALIRDCDAALKLCRKAVSHLEELDTELAGQQAPSCSPLPPLSPCSSPDNSAIFLRELAKGYTWNKGE